MIYYPYYRSACTQLIMRAVIYHDVNKKFRAFADDKLHNFQDPKERCSTVPARARIECSSYNFERMTGPVTWYMY